MADYGALDMNKTHLTYLLMVAIFAGGLWGILRLGAGLHAARNVAGEWDIVWTHPTPNQALPDRMTVDQSGRYLTATMKGPAAPVLLRGRITSDGQVSRISLHDAGSSWKLAARLDDKQLLTGSLQTPAPHALQARRAATHP